MSDYYTKTELNTSGAGGQVHWDNVTNFAPTTYVQDNLVSGESLQVTSGEVFHVKGDSGNVGILIPDPEVNCKEITLIGMDDTNYVTVPYCPTIDLLGQFNYDLKKGNILKLIWCDEESLWRETFSYLSFD